MKPIVFFIFLLSVFNYVVSLIDARDMRNLEKRVEALEKHEF